MHFFLTSLKLTAPCPPKAPKVYRECATNVNLFSWEPTNNTAYYFAIAVDSDGLVMECVTMETSCYFTDTVCGQTYSFHISAVYSGGIDCNSGYTEGVVIKTGELVILVKINKYTIFCDFSTGRIILQLFMLVFLFSGLEDI